MIMSAGSQRRCALMIWFTWELIRQSGVVVIGCCLISVICMGRCYRVSLWSVEFVKRRMVRRLCTCAMLSDCRDERIYVMVL